MDEYSKAIDYLYSRLPLFSSQGKSAIRPGLDNTIKLLNLLGDPHKHFRSIHVGGTNGKGSTSHMLSAILQTAGYKTGLYTSPHLKDFRERIRIDGGMINKAEVVDFVRLYRTEIEKIEPSFFEVTVALAFQSFSRYEVDIAVVEVGLGGRLDSTNVIDPILSVITNIGYDHMDVLGDTLQQIAGEKAGIIKRNTPVIIGERSDQTSGIFLKHASDKEADLVFASDMWKVQILEQNTDQKKMSVEISCCGDTENPFRFSKLDLDLTGTYQLKNVASVLSSVLNLRSQGFRIEDEHVQTALANVQQLTGFMGRWQTISTSPRIILDTGHNEDGIKQVISNINSSSFKSLHIVFGMLKDKDSRKILRFLPKNAQYYFCQVRLQRAKPAEDLAKEASEFGLKGFVYDTVADALAAAKLKAGSDDLIFVGGSTFVVAEVV